jgi:ABC-type nitrate/sulfonate/bicarbonate transport system substrate-binding protein
VSFPLGGLGTTDHKLTTNRAEVKKVLRAYLRALQLMHRDEETTVAIIRDYLEVDEDVARQSYQFVRDTMSQDGVPPEEGVRLIIDIERATVGMTEQVPFSAVMDLSVLEEVRREMAGATPTSR